VHVVDEDRVCMMLHRPLLLGALAGEIILETGVSVLVSTYRSHGIVIFSIESATNA